MHKLYRLTNLEFPHTGLISNTWFLRPTRFPAFLQSSVCTCLWFGCYLWVRPSRPHYLFSPSVALFKAWLSLRRSRSLTCPSWWLPSTAWWAWPLCSPVWPSTWSSTPTSPPTLQPTSPRSWLTWERILVESLSVALWWHTANCKVKRSHVVMIFSRKQIIKHMYS